MHLYFIDSPTPFPVHVKLSYRRSNTILLWFAFIHPSSMFKIKPGKENEKTDTMFPWYNTRPKIPWIARQIKKVDCSFL